MTPNQSRAKGKSLRERARRSCRRARASCRWARSGPRRSHIACQETAIRPAIEATGWFGRVAAVWGIQEPVRRTWCRRQSLRVHRPELCVKGKSPQGTTGHSSFAMAAYRSARIYFAARVRLEEWVRCSHPTRGRSLRSAATRTSRKRL
jgi:hypothetical protein